MRDFTITAYQRLVTALQDRYALVPVRDFDPAVNKRVAVLRHDVDRDVNATVRCAETLRDLGAVATFYFRYPATFVPEVLAYVESLGHEVGYHYEVLTKTNGDIPRAVKLFAEELSEIRRVCAVDTACMHGSPLSRWDSRDIWRYVALGEFQLAAEPYLSFDFSKVAYLTDTGRSWAGGRFSVRDRVNAMPQIQARTTAELITALGQSHAPAAIMLTFHPERWSSGYLEWGWQLVYQNFKNLAKAALIRARDTSPS